MNIHVLSPIHVFNEHESNSIIFESSPNDTLNHVCDLLADRDLPIQYSSPDRPGDESLKDISIFLTRRRFGPAGRQPLEE